MKNIILISGLKRSGKNYTATKLQEYLQQHNLTAHQISFAKKLKEDVAEIFEITVGEVETLKDDNIMLYYGSCLAYNFTMRKILQQYGMLRRKENDSVWIEYVEDEILENDFDVYIITDWRFKSEFEYFDWDDKIYNIIDLRIENDYLEHDDEHISENDLKGFNFTYTLKNNYKDENFDLEAEYERVFKDILSDVVV